MARQCKGSWLDTYLEYCHNQESPTAFHEWVALSVLGAVIGRHVWIPRIKYTIYPNLFVILVAGSAQCRKSVAINMGVDLLKSVENPPMVFAQKITTEALIQALDQAKLGGSSSGLVCASELSVFMGSEGIKSGIIPTLTDLYDSPKEWVYHTRGRGKEVLQNVTLSILAASTKDWLRSSIPADAVGGGFTSRIIFVYQDAPSKLVLFPVHNPEEPRLRKALIDDLSYIRNNLTGKISFTLEAKEVAEEWYKREHAKIRDAKLEGYFGRKHDIMFKLASLISVGENDSCIVDSPHIKRALLLLEENEENLGSIIASVVATTVGGETERIYTIIKKAGLIKHSELLRKCWRVASSVEVSIMLRTLLESQEIKEVLSADGKSRFYEVVKRR